MRIATFIRAQTSVEFERQPASRVWGPTSSAHVTSLRLNQKGHQRPSSKLHRICTCHQLSSQPKKGHRTSSDYRQPTSHKGPSDYGTEPSELSSKALELSSSTSREDISGWSSNGRQPKLLCEWSDLEPKWIWMMVTSSRWVRSRAKMDMDGRYARD